jgi:hypothetical protein
MAIFSEKIMEARYTNARKDTVEIVYKEEKKAIVYYIQTNHNHPDFQDLIKEYPLDKIQATTTAKIKQYNNKLKEANKADLDKLKEELKTKASSFGGWYEFMFNFDKENPDHMDFLFQLKLKLFDEKKVKSLPEEKKNIIRDSLNPMKIIKCLM